MIHKIMNHVRADEPSSTHMIPTAMSGMMGRAFKFWDLVSSILTRLPWGRIGNNYSKIEMTTLFISRLVQYTKKMLSFHHSHKTYLFFSFV
jgi:cytochrome b